MNVAYARSINPGKVPIHRDVGATFYFLFIAERCRDRRCENSNSSTDSDIYKPDICISAHRTVNRLTNSQIAAGNAEEEHLEVR